MSSISAYNDYAKNTLMPMMKPEMLDEIPLLETAKDYENPCTWNS